MAGNDPLVAEYNERDAVKAGVLWRDRVLGVQDIRLSTGLILTGGTTPIIAQQTVTDTGANNSPFNIVRWAAGDAAAITLACEVPGDYNETIDKLHLRLKVWKSTAGNTGIAMTGVMAAVRNGVDVTASTVLVVSNAPVISDAVTPSILDFDFSGDSLKGKDSLCFKITPDAHNTCVIDLYGATLRYIGGTSLFNETDRYAS